MVDINQSLDVGESLRREKEVEEMVKTKLEGNQPEKKPEENPKEEERPKSEEKKVVKKNAPKPVNKKAQKRSKKKDEDYDFDDDFGESGLGKYVFWAVIIIAAVLLALWLFTDWTVCVQF